jgi:hypothetical protein
MINTRHVDLIGIKSLVDITNNTNLLDSYNVLDDDEQVIENDEMITKDNDPVQNFIDNTEDVMVNMPTTKTKYSYDNSFLDIDENNNNKSSNYDINSGIKNYHYSANDDKDDDYEDDEKFNNTDDDLVKNYINEGEFTDSSKKNFSSKTYEEEIDDEKILLMDKIDEIKKILYKKNISVENVPIVNYKSSLAEIKYTYRLLQVKNNRDLNINFTNNMVKISISLLEKVFDGKKTYFGITPNIVGYSKVAQLQLQDLHIESEQLSGEIFNRESTHPAFKIAAALIPGMIYYSSTRTNNSVVENSDSETKKKAKMEEAISEIENI